jgi:serine/threonine protein phosphatase 1
MIDRGPDPVRVMRIVRAIPQATVLMGNHEDLMLNFFAHPDDHISVANWAINGGKMTLNGLEAMDSDEAVELVDWAGTLPRWSYVQVDGRYYLLCHAGLRPSPHASRGVWSDASVEALLEAQDPDDLVWIREEFWGVSTGLVGEDGLGPIVIAGHTPTPYLNVMTDLVDRPTRNEEGIAQMVRVGACDATGGVADRWDIDCGAAGGAGYGQITVLRLDDGEEFCESIREGE